MSIGQLRAARRKIQLRYKAPRRFRTIAQSIELERQRAARAAATKSKKK